MKRFFLVLFAAAFMLTGCGLGYRSGAYYPDDYHHHGDSRYYEDAAVVFIADSRYNINVRIDRDHYRVRTVRERDFWRNRNVGKVYDNMIVVSPGRHKITVRRRGRVLLDERVNVYAGEAKTIYLDYRY